MLVKILGAIDIFGGLVLFIIGFGVNMSLGVLIFFSILFGLKSLFIFSKDVASLLDVLACLVLIFSIFILVPSILVFLSGFLVFQKGFLSFLG